MTSGLLAVATVLTVALLIWLPLRWAFPVFVMGLILVPDTMRAPVVGGQLLLVRLVALAFLAGLVLRVGRGDVRSDAFRPTWASLGLIGFGVVAWVVGVMGAAGDVPATFSRDAWMVIPDQLIVLVGAMAAARTIGSTRAALSLASVTTAAAAIAVLERLTGHGYAQLAFSGLPDQRTGGAGSPLEIRSGEVRPRVASRYALAYAWQATMLLPLVVASAATARRAWRAVAVPLVVLAITLTSTRSAYAGVAVGLVAFALLSRRRSVVISVVGLTLVGGLALGASGTLADAFHAPEAAGSNAIRDERAPVVLGAVADDPYTGLGYGALLDQGLSSTDSSWLQTYAELGAVGVAALVISIVAALATIGPALTGSAERSPQRLVAAACWAGVALSLAGSASFDLFSGRQSVLPLWVLAAVGAVAAEEVPERRSALRPQVVRPAVLLGWGIATGFAFLLLTPRPANAVVSLELVPVAVDSAAGAPGSFVGRTLARTACTVLTEAVESSGAGASCVLPVGRGAGAALLRVTSPSERTTVDATQAALHALDGLVPSARVIDMDVEGEAVPSLVRTAPLSGAAVGAALALLVAAADRRRPSPAPVAMR